MKMTNAFLVLALACFSGCAFQVPLSNNLSVSPQPITGSKLPLNVGLVIDAQTKNFQKKIRPSGIGAKVHTFCFSVGEELSKSILRASEASFEKVTVLESLPKSPSKDFDAYLIAQDLTADIQIHYANTGTAIAFGLIGQMMNPIHSTDSSALSLSVRMVDAHFNSIYSSSILGKGSSDVPSSMTGIKPAEFSGGVNDAMQDLTKNFMTEILTSQKIKDYAKSIKTI